MKATFLACVQGTPDSVEQTSTQSTRKKKNLTSGKNCTGNRYGISQRFRRKNTKLNSHCVHGRPNMFNKQQILPALYKHMFKGPALGCQLIRTQRSGYDTTDLHMRIHEHISCAYHDDFVRLSIIDEKKQRLSTVSTCWYACKSALFFPRWE
jgi:hypothetical protein